MTLCRETRFLYGQKPNINNYGITSAWISFATSFSGVVSDAVPFRTQKISTLLIFGIGVGLGSIIGVMSTAYILRYQSPPDADEDADSDVSETKSKILEFIYFMSN